MQGDVHDPRAWALGGVAGHAGLFSTVHDLARYAQMMLDGGAVTREDRTDRILSPATIAAMTRGYPVEKGIRGLGWDKQTGYSINRGDLMTRSAFGHGGFTGNRPLDRSRTGPLLYLSQQSRSSARQRTRQSFGGTNRHTVVAAIDAPSTSQPPSQGPVLAGIDVLRRDSFRLLANQRVGVITNHTGRDLEGTSLVKLLSDAPNVQLRGLFSPEHGFEGKLDIPPSSG